MGLAQGGACCSSGEAHCWRIKATWPCPATIPVHVIKKKKSLKYISLILLCLLLCRILPLSRNASKHHLRRGAPLLPNYFFLPFAAQTKNYTAWCIYSALGKESPDGTCSFWVTPEQSQHQQNTESN